MSEMVERMRNAMIASDQAEPMFACACLGKQRPDDPACPCRMRDAERRARAAIEAMREPNDVMLAAGQWTISDNLTVSVCVENNRKAAQIWQAMIGKALPHQEGEGGK